MGAPAASRGRGRASRPSSKGAAQRAQALTAIERSPRPTSKGAARRGEKRPASAGSSPGLKSRKQSLRFSSRSFECALCCVDVEAGEAVRLACSHGWYCRGCVERYAEARLAEGAVDVSCPDCREPIPDHDLKSILAQDIISRFHERSISRALASSSNLHACPTPGCSMCFEIEDGVYHLRACPKCKQSSCLRCGAQPYHEGLSCQEHAARVARRKQGSQAGDRSLMRWMKRTGTKQCPRCNAGVSKEDLASQGTQRKECHKMMCRECNTKFCFKCLAILTDTYTCGCSIEAHGFVNPFTGKRVKHLSRKARRSLGGA